MEAEHTRCERPGKDECFGKNRPPGPRACNTNTYGLRRLILIHGGGGNININAERARAAGRRKSHGADLWETASSARRLDEVGNGNLGVPLLPTKLPTISRFRASGKTPRNAISRSEHSPQAHFVRY